MAFKESFGKSESANNVEITSKIQLFNQYCPNNSPLTPTLHFQRKRPKSANPRCDSLRCLIAKKPWPRGCYRWTNWNNKTAFEAFSKTICSAEYLTCIISATVRDTRVVSKDHFTVNHIGKANPLVTWSMTSRDELTLSSEALSPAWQKPYSLCPPDLLFPSHGDQTSSSSKAFDSDRHWPRPQRYDELTCLYRWAHAYNDKYYNYNSTNYYCFAHESVWLM